MRGKKNKTNNTKPNQQQRLLEDFSELPHLTNLLINKESSNWGLRGRDSKGMLQLQMAQPQVSNKGLRGSTAIWCGCIDIRCVYKFYLTLLGAARRMLQLQHCHVVWCRSNKDIPWDKEGQLRASGRPVATKVEAIDPNLPLVRQKEKRTCSLFDRDLLW